MASSADWYDELNLAANARRICNHRGLSITFKPSDSAGDEAYEAFIARTGRVPTRGNLHDFFNALVWLRFPLAKAHLNQLQSSDIARVGVGAVRGRLRDALTLIDESAVLLVTERADMVAWLRNHDWKALFQRERSAWNTDIRVLGFGHALLEKLVNPYKAVTAHALHVPLAADATVDQVDRCVASAIDDQLSPHDLMPLPVLGIPGWWAPNDAPDFYSDRTVFRPAKMRPEKVSGDAIE